MGTFEDAYRRHYPTVVRSAWSICRDQQRAEEHAQEAFARAYRRWRRLEGSSHCAAWLHRVAMNLAISDVRRRTRGSELEQRSSGVAFVARPAQTDPDWLVDTLKRLPRRQREAVFLRVIVDLPVEEVASLMGCSDGSVKTHTSRGLQRLRQLLNTTEQDGRDGSARTATEAAHG